MSDPPSLRPSLPEWAIVSDRRRAHIQRVAQLVQDWGASMGVPEPELARWLKAAWLHDALRDAPVEELSRWAATGGAVSLLHGPAAAGRAKSLGETDRGVLDAVRYHSVGLAEWDMVGRVLYCADFLEPGRSEDREARAELAERFPTDPASVIRRVAEWRVGLLIAARLPIPEPTFRFWNALVSPAPAASR